MTFDARTDPPRVDDEGPVPGSPGLSAGPKLFAIAIARPEGPALLGDAEGHVIGFEDADMARAISAVLVAHGVGPLLAPVPIGAPDVRIVDTDEAAHDVLLEVLDELVAHRRTVATAAAMS